jgi:peptidoglycan/LPS O-acetylase OafA/YrhL
MVVEQKLAEGKDTKFRYIELDCLRGIAVTLVMLHHYVYDYDFHYNLFPLNRFTSLYTYIQPAFYYGYLAVHLFFVISGFVIFMTIERSRNKMDFIVSRFSRIYPAYFCAVLITIMFLYILPLPNWDVFGFKEIVMNLTMSQGLFKIHNIDQVYWTLSVEIKFYVIIYILFLTGILNRVSMLGVCWLSLSAISVIYNIPFKKYLDVLLILPFAPLFVSGMLFYKIKKQQITNRNLTITLILAAYIIQSLWILENSEAGNADIIIVGFIYLTFFIFSNRGLAFIINKPLLFLGSISYSLYLLHNVIGYVLIYQIRKITNLPVVYLLIPCVTTIAMAYFLHMYVEKPAMKLMRSLNPSSLRYSKS